MIDISGKNIYIVSDLHIGDGLASDNFFPVKERFLSFLDFFEKQENSVLVLNGDTFEFWQSSMVDVFYNNYCLLQTLINDNAIFIAGNHDYELLTFAKLQLNEDLDMKIVKDMDLKINGKKIKIIHGHEFDPFNQPGVAAFTGKIVSLLFADIEENNPGSGIEGWFQKNVEPIARGIVLFFSGIYKTLFTNNSKINGELDIEIEEYHRNNPDITLIAAHIHKAGWWNNFYINSGAWVEGSEPHYVKIDPSGNIKLFSWPEQQEITKQVDLYGFISETAVKNLYNNRNDNKDK